MNVANQLTAFLFPLITFPYISRILQPAGLGKINFAQALVSYFVILAAIGIPTYGMREVSKVRNDSYKKSQLIAELFLLNMITMIITLIVFCVFMTYSEKAASEKVLFWLCIIPMILSPFEFNFLFEGNEDFTYLAIRSIIFRAINIGAIFIFVKTQNDYITLALINGLTYALSILINLLYLNRHINFKSMTWSSLSIWKHIKPTSIIFLFGGIICIYTSLDIIMLGYLTNDAQVGYYSISDKLVKVIIMGITAFNSVVTPRAINYIENKRYDEFQEITQLSVKIILFFTFPSALGLFLLAKPFVLLFGGGAYFSSINLIQVMSLNIIFISLSNFIGFQILYSNNKETLLLYSVLLGACVNFILNLIFIPKFQAYGAAISTLASEGLVTFMQIIYSRSVKIFIWPFQEIKMYMISACCMGIVLCVLKLHVESHFVQLYLCIPVGIIVYLTGLYISNDPILHAFVRKL